MVDNRIINNGWNKNLTVLLLPLAINIKIHGVLDHNTVGATEQQIWHKKLSDWLKITYTYRRPSLASVWPAHFSTQGWLVPQCVKALCVLLSEEIVAL